MNRTLGKVLIVASSFASVFFIHFGFSDKTKGAGWFIIMGFIAALLLIISLSVAYSLGMGRPASLFSLKEKKVYKLIAMTKTTDGKFLYSIEYPPLEHNPHTQDSHITRYVDVLSIVSDEQCIVSKYSFTCPVFVEISVEKDKHVLRIRGQ